MFRSLTLIGWENIIDQAIKQFHIPTKMFVIYKQINNNSRNNYYRLVFFTYISNWLSRYHIESIQIHIS